MTSSKRGFPRAAGPTRPERIGRTSSAFVWTRGSRAVKRWRAGAASPVLTGRRKKAWLPASAAPSACLPDGYRLVEAREISVAEKALLHARAFGYAGTWIEAAKRAFARLPLAPDYRPEA